LLVTLARVMKAVATVLLPSLVVFNELCKESTAEGSGNDESSYDSEMLRLAICCKIKEVNAADSHEVKVAGVSNSCHKSSGNCCKRCESWLLVPACTLVWLRGMFLAIAWMISILPCRRRDDTACSRYYESSQRNARVFCCFRPCGQGLVMKLI
jgi:hypothetical protein